jgi:hypothetical protein
MPNHVGVWLPGVTGAEESNVNPLASESVNYHARSTEIRTACIVGWRIEDLAVA